MIGQNSAATANVNATFGTSFTSHTAYLTSLPWLVALLNGGGKP
jgi:hypothetical protein